MIVASIDEACAGKSHASYAAARQELARINGRNHRQPHVFMHCCGCGGGHIMSRAEAEEWLRANRERGAQRRGDSRRVSGEEMLARIFDRMMSNAGHNRAAPAENHDDR